MSGDLTFLTLLSMVGGTWSFGVFPVKVAEAPTPTLDFKVSLRGVSKQPTGVMACHPDSCSGTPLELCSMPVGTTCSAVPATCAAPHVAIPAVLLAPCTNGFSAAAHLLRWCCGTYAHHVLALLLRIQLLLALRALPLLSQRPLLLSALLPLEPTKSPSLLMPSLL